MTRLVSSLNFLRHRRSRCPGTLFDTGRDMNRPNSPHSWVLRRQSADVAPLARFLFAAALVLSALAAAAQDFDFGDAPEVFPVSLGQDGARHALGNLRLGTNVDKDPDGLASADALKDDLTDLDDEDGVQLVGGALIPGQNADIKVEMMGGDQAFLNIWIDFNQNGDWSDAPDHVVADATLTPGVRTFTVRVPTGIPSGIAFARFRLSTQQNLGVKGPAEDGEVEDYAFNVSSEQSGEQDFGDAPDSYRTTLSKDGARHSRLQEFHLGPAIDLEQDGQPSVGATGDDLLPSIGPDDEDGVELPGGSLQPGQMNTVKVTLTGSVGRLDAWMDFNQDGMFDEKSERIFSAAPLGGGGNNLSFHVPQAAKPGSSYARFRLSQEGGLPPFGDGGAGEVEDHYFDIAMPQGQLDFGDAPQSYPVTISQNGAAHVVVQGVHLGALIDAEADGQIDVGALGDDQNPPGAGDDEDGVALVAAPLNPGSVEQVDVVLSTGKGRLDAWVDFNGNGNWNDAGEKIFHAEAIVAGNNRLSFFVPGDAKRGATFSRWRLSQDGGLDVTGVVTGGEVEDHAFVIGPPEQGECDPRTHRGLEFWLAFPGNLTAGQTDGHSVELCITGARGTQGLVEMPGLAVPFSKPFSIGAANFVIVTLPLEADMADQVDVTLPHGIHVTADREVAVYALNRFPFTTDGYLGLPTDIISGDYIVQCYPNVQSGVSELNGSQFAVVATQDDTTVIITPSASAAGYAAGVPYMKTLNRGDVYQLRSDKDTPADLSGSLVMANKPVGVFGSHQCAFIDSPSTFFCDYLVEQMLPVHRAGTYFLATPLATRTGNILCRVTAIADGTDVLVNGVYQTTLMQGKTHDISLGGAAAISTTKPALVGQFSPSSDHDGVVDSDPFMVNLQHTGQFLDRYEVCLPGHGFMGGYVNVITTGAGVGSITVDGAPIPAGNYVAIGASGYFYARPAVSAGLHVLAGNVPFGAFVYGWMEYESFGYPAGLLIGDSQPPVLTCPTEEVQLQVSRGTANGAFCRAVLPDFRSNIAVTDNCPLRQEIVITQFPAPGTLLAPGAHNVFVTAEDDAGNTGFCVIRVVVVDPEPGDLLFLCPQDIIVNCKTPHGAVVNYQVSVSQGCADNLPVTCHPPSGSLFPPGTTVVTCVTRDINGNTHTCTFKITVNCDQNPPGIVKIPDRVRHVLGEAFNLQAQVGEVAEAQFQWFHNGNPVEGANSSTLSIDSVDPTHAGLYWVSVRNPYGVSFSNRSLLLIGSSVLTNRRTAEIVDQLRNEGFPLKFRLRPDRQFDVQVSTDLVSWTTIATVQGATTEFLDSAARGKLRRFYRIVEK